MARIVDGFSLLLLLLACGAFVLGLRALSSREDLLAIFSVLAGGLALKSSVELMRARGQ
ncbi:MAG: hypothetical protein MUF64_32965 [Polyangiaceae bacterium]|nr:hypothetical protein [Polyangiaceae bacterium]